MQRSELSHQEAKSYPQAGILGRDKEAGMQPARKPSSHEEGEDRKEEEEGGQGNPEFWFQVYWALLEM